MNFPGEGPFILWLAVPKSLSFCFFTGLLFFNLLLVVRVSPAALRLTLIMGAGLSPGSGTRPGPRRYRSPAAERTLSSSPCLVESPQTRSWGRFLPAILPEKSPSSRFHSLCSEILPSQETPSRPVYPLRLPRVARSGLPGLFVFSQHLGTLSGLSLSLSY